MHNHDDGRDVVPCVCQSSPGLRQPWRPVSHPCDAQPTYPSRDYRGLFHVHDTCVGASIEMRLIVRTCMVCLPLAASWNACGPHAAVVGTVTLDGLPGRLSTVRSDFVTVGCSEYSQGRRGGVGSRDTERGHVGGSKGTNGSGPTRLRTDRTEREGRSRGKEPTKKGGSVSLFAFPRKRTDGEWTFPGWRGASGTVGSRTFLYRRGWKK